MSVNLLSIFCISIGYFIIFYKVRSKTINNCSEKRSENDKKLLIRVFLIITTDVACWLPIIVLSYASYFGYPIPDVMHPISSIVLLPINSLINPILYSKVEVTLYKLFKMIFMKFETN